MIPDRPDLSQTSSEVRAYVEALEAELTTLREQSGKSKATPAEPLEPGEPPTTINVITLSQNGLIKRTPRHHYQRQRRGGMGVFDLEASEDDPPRRLAIADEAQPLLVVTNQARVFRLRLSTLPESPIRAKGQALDELLSFQGDERPTLLIPYQETGHLNVVSDRGQVRRYRANIFGEKMAEGLSLWELRDFGMPTAAGWSSGNDDLFIATRQGRAIRFAESQIPVRGGQGIRLENEDTVVGVVAVQADSGVFLLSADGKGTIRLMEGFSPNKAPGSGGKAAMKTDHLVGAVTISPKNDLFLISRLSKTIRFQASEVPATPGVVQGVHCMALRADETVALAAS